MLEGAAGGLQAGDDSPWLRRYELPPFHIAHYTYSFDPSSVCKSRAAF